MCRKALPLRLVQILPSVLSMQVVGAVSLGGYRPVVCRSESLDARDARDARGAAPAEVGEQIDCSRHLGSSPACVK